MKSQAIKKLNLPDKPGVYFFIGKQNSSRPPLIKGGVIQISPDKGDKGGCILYIGKATSLKDRVRSYFYSDLIKTRGMLLVDMIARAETVKYIQTDSVLEALILEANEIKKYQPYYNTKEKDDKSFNYVCITKDNKVAVVRGKELQNISSRKISPSAPASRTLELRNFFTRYVSVYGPFTSGPQLREALKIIRKLFPYIEERKGTKGREEFYKQIKLFPADSIENKNNIKNIKLFFEGKKKKILFILKKEMMSLAKQKEFEKAEEIKRKIFALNHINDIALIKNETQNYPLRHSQSVLEGQVRSVRSEDSYEDSSVFNNFDRIEAYDIAHMSGKNMVGVMVVVQDGELEKSEYKKFKIKTQTDANDTGALAEVLERRFMHTEWTFPDIIVVDGSTAQINVAKKVLLKMKLNIKIVAVVKDEKHKAKAILGNEELLKKYKQEILLANSEAHRFAVNYHKNMRNKNFIPPSLKLRRTRK